MDEEADPTGPSVRSVRPSGRGDAAGVRPSIPAAVQNPAALDSLLSPREQQVLEATALGLTNSEVAKRLEVSVHAVKFHLAGVYRKLGVANRTEAAVVYTTAVARQAR